MDVRVPRIDSDDPGIAMVKYSLEHKAPGTIYVYKGDQSGRCKVNPGHAGGERWECGHLRAGEG